MNKLLTGLSLALTTLAAQASPQTVDIMVLYTKDALALPNGRDIDARIAKAVKAGAQVMKPAFDIPGVGRIAILLEPGGAAIGWMTPTV